MQSSIQLQLDRSTLVFTPVHCSGEQLEISVALSADSDLGFACPEVRCYLSVEDVTLLIGYIDSHVEGRRQEKFIEQKKRSFVPGELGFKVHALSGVYGGDRLGYFSMSIMINVTDSASGQPRVYVGLESSVFVDDALAWCVALTALIDSLATDDQMTPGSGPGVV